MLTELDIELIEQESHRFDTKKIKTWLKPICECPIGSFDDLAKQYNVQEFTIHWYDAGPPDCRDYNHQCSYKGSGCNECPIEIAWDGSRDQLSFNNWIDVEGPGIWGETQESVNLRIIELFKEDLLTDSDFELRTFYFQPPDKDLFDVFYYNRDRKRCDYWFVFRRKAS